MPRYRFNIHNGIGFVEDEEGRDLPDLDAARTEAVKDIRSILVEDMEHGRIDLCGRIEVVGESGVAVLSVAFEEAVQILRPQG
jgi:hypothetical protein